MSARISLPIVSFGLVYLFPGFALCVPLVWPSVNLLLLFGLMMVWMATALALLFTSQFAARMMGWMLLTWLPFPLLSMVDLSGLTWDLSGDGFPLNWMTVGVRVLQVIAPLVMGVLIIAYGQLTRYSEKRWVLAQILLLLMQIVIDFSSIQ